MDYDIYFHNDFDGVASSAVMLSFLRSRGDDIENFHPLNFKIKAEWPRFTFKNPAIIVDFLYHPKAAFWFDHHPTTFLRDSWKKKFKSSKWLHWGIKYASCCHLALDELAKHYNFKPPRHLKELARWLDVIDGANYKSARQAILKKEPALRLGACIDKKSGDNNFLVWLIKFLSNNSIKSSLKAPEVKNILQSAMREEKLSLGFYEKNIKSFGKISFVDISGKQVSELNMAPFYFRPRSRYSIALKGGGNFFHLMVGVNPWRRRETKIHIGRLMEKYGGGGHKVVGAADFQSREKIDEAVEQIIGILNKK